MKTLLIVLLGLVLALEGKILERQHGPRYNFPRTYQTKWRDITMKLDHFNPADRRTFSMRLIENESHFKPGGPMIIYLGGEWEISPGYIENGLMVDIAKEHGGYLYYTEHRYYGETQPTKDWSSENLQYLSVDQAIEDVVHFIKQEKKRNPQLAESKVAVVGASYSAEMATWLRLKYPHVIDAAWASSAPLKAQVDFPEYFEVVADNIKLTSAKCYDTIREGSDLLMQLIKTAEGRKKITTDFGLCTDLIDVFPHNEHFFNTINEVWAGNVQYAWPGAIKSHCDALLGFGGNAMEKLGSYVQAQYGGYCVGDYKEFLEYYAGNEINYGIYRQWYHQICTEFGYLQTITSANTPFGLNSCTPKYYFRVCQDLFGNSFNETMMEEAVERTNAVYGGNTPVISNVISIHGKVDPWHTPGILKSLHEDAPAMLVEGAAHCQDMGSLIPSDSQQMQQAKQLIIDSFARWLKK